MIVDKPTECERQSERRGLRGSLWGVLPMLWCIVASACGESVRPMPSPSAIRLIGGTYTLTLTASTNCNTSLGPSGFITPPFTLEQHDAKVTAHLEVPNFIGGGLSDYVDLSGTVNGAALLMTFSAMWAHGGGRFGSQHASGTGTGSIQSAKISGSYDGSYIFFATAGFGALVYCPTLPDHRFTLTKL